jgi:YaiO family outer membrane protein
VGILLLIPLTSLAASVESRLKDARENSYEKNYKEAIIIYDSILKSEPDNIEALNGKARVLSWMGKLNEAESLYSTVLSKYPRNLGAVNGLADIYAWQHDYEKAINLLEVIIKDHPDNRSVLIRLARFNVWAKNKRQSLYYSEKILSNAPDDGEAKEIRSQAKALYTYEYYAGYNHLDINTTVDGNNGYVGLRYKPDKENYSFYGQVDYLDRFNKTDIRILGGGYFQILKQLDIEMAFSVTPSADVYPRFSEFVELVSPKFSPLVLYTTLSFSQYKDANLYGISFAGEYYTFWNLSVLMRYTNSRVDFDNGDDSSDSSYMIKVSRYINDRDKIYVYYAEGDESYRIGTIDSIGDIDAKIYGVGGTYFITPAVGISPSFEFQDREGGTEYQQFGLEVKCRM